MGHIFSNVEGTEKNYTQNLENYELTHDDRKQIDSIFNNIKNIGSFYDNNDNKHDLGILWHNFCYKHRLIINKIRFESFQILYNKFNRKYEIGFNAMWHLQNNEKIPIQSFKLERMNKSSSTYYECHSNWYIYIGLKSNKQRKLDIINYINISYSFYQDIYGEIDELIIDILCDYLPSNHIFNYKGCGSFKLCKFSSSTTSQTNEEETENPSESTSSMMEIINLVQNKDNFVKIINMNTVKLIKFEYDINEHEILQFVKYLLLFFYHKYVNKWIKSKCNHHSQQNVFINNALNEVMNIWRSTERERSTKNKKVCNNKNIRVK